MYSGEPPWYPLDGTFGDIVPRGRCDELDKKSCEWQQLQVGSTDIATVASM